MPSSPQDLGKLILDGITYDIIKLIVGALIVAIAGAAVGNITNRLKTYRETIAVGIALFIGTLVLISLISPRSQTPQLGGNIEYTIFGPTEDGKGTIAVLTVDITNCLWFGGNVSSTF